MIIVIYTTLIFISLISIALYSVAWEIVKNLREMNNYLYLIRHLDLMEIKNEKRMKQ